MFIVFDDCKSGSEFLPEVLSVFVISHLCLSLLFRSKWLPQSQKPVVEHPQAGSRGAGPSSGAPSNLGSLCPSGAQALLTLPSGQLHTFLVLT